MVKGGQRLSTQAMCPMGGTYPAPSPLWHRTRNGNNIRGISPTLPKSRQKHSRLDAWQLGNRYARQERQKWLGLVTVDSLAEVLLTLQKYGFCTLNQMQNLFEATCKPDEEQRDYILTVPEADTHSLFEGAILTDTLGYTALHWPKDSKVGQRMQLKPQMGCNLRAVQKDIYAAA
jgi:hypothetical protein